MFNNFAEILRSRIFWVVVATYVVLSAPLHLIWEFGHMPLYQVWNTGSNGEIIYNGLHCTFGDMLIATSSLIAAAFLTGNGRWPDACWWSVVQTAIVLGVAYTAFSEWHNVYVLESWAYAPSMPTLPGTGIGLSPLLQWLVVPTVGFVVSRHLTS